MRVSFKWHGPAPRPAPGQWLLFHPFGGEATFSASLVEVPLHQMLGTCRFLIRLWTAAALSAENDVKAQNVHVEGQGRRRSCADGLRAGRTLPPPAPLGAPCSPFTWMESSGIPVHGSEFLSLQVWYPGGQICDAALKAASGLPSRRITAPCPPGFPASVHFLLQFLEGQKFPRMPRPLCPVPRGHSSLAGSDGSRVESALQTLDTLILAKE